MTATEETRMWAFVAYAIELLGADNDGFGFVRHDELLESVRVVALEQERTFVDRLDVLEAGRLERFDVLLEVGERDRVDDLAYEQ